MCSGWELDSSDGFGVVVAAADDVAASPVNKTKEVKAVFTNCIAGLT